MTETLPEPKSRKESYLAKAAGMSVSVPDKPESREEQYLAAIAEGGGGGGGPTVVQTTGQSTTDVMSQKAVTDALANGGFKLLTADDYNYDYGNTGSNNIVALWKLPEGGYYTNDDTVKITPTTGTIAAVGPNYWRNYSGVFFVGPSDAFGKHIIMINNRGGGQNGQLRTITKVNVDPDSGSSWGYQSALDNQNVKNVLDSYETEFALSANQGRILNGKIEGRIITGAGAPTTSTVGTVGLLYEDTTNGKLYICTDATNPYVWTEIGAGGGGGDTVYSDKSTSASNTGGAVYIGNLNSNQEEQPDPTTTDWHNKYFWALPYSNSDVPLNQSVAILGKVGAGGGSGYGGIAIGSGFANCATAWGDSSVAIGMDANATSQAVAIGMWANAGEGTMNIHHMMALGCNSYAAEANYSMNIAVNDGSGYGVRNDNSTASIAIGKNSRIGDAEHAYKNAVALGSYAKVTRQGELNIGLVTDETTGGYNDSAYRIIGGVYDGQLAHDAVTVEQVNGVIDAINTALSTNISHIGA